jgi:centromere/kinetochore protein ZW10
MSSKASSTDISHAILQHVEVKAYPDSDELASANLYPPVLPTVIEAIGKERDKVKVCGLSTV